MAEAISVVGLVSRIIAFIGFGFKVISETKKLRDAAVQGSSDEIEELDRYLQDVREGNSKVKQQRTSGLVLSNDERNIVQMI